MPINTPVGELEHLFFKIIATLDLEQMPEGSAFKDPKTIRKVELIKTMYNIKEQARELAKPRVNMPKIVCNWNVSIKPDQMEPKSLYLDGSCRGFALRPEIGSVSFDHHTGCNRSITYATCVQVMHGIMHGMKVTDFDQIIIDDIDADTVMSVWILLNQKQLDDEKVVSIINQIGLVDAHFTVAFDLHPLHKMINPKYGYERTEELLYECLAIVDSYIADPTQTFPTFDWVKPDGEKDECVGFTRAGHPLKSIASFEDMYADGFGLVMMTKELPNGSRIYTIGKKSEFEMWVDLPAILAKLGKAELQACHDLGTSLYLGPTKNWGGSTTIGGSARYEDQSQGSRLALDEVIEIIERHITGEDQ